MKSESPKHAVCHLVSGDLWAGAEVMVFHLLKALSNINTLSVSAIVFNDGRLASELKNAGIELTVIEESRYSFPVLVYKSYQVLRTKNVSILHSHRRKENFIALVVAIFLRGVKLIHTQHGMPESSPANRLNLSSIISGINFKLLSLFFHRNVVVSNEIRKLLIFQRGFHEQKTVAIHNGIPDTTFLSTNRNTGAQPFTIGSAGRLVKVKDFGLFIAISDLLRNYDQIKFLLAGDGPLYSELSRKISESGLNNFTFSGNVDDMNSFYSKVDLFLNTSLHEGVPMSILEAMSYGKPVIAPRVGGIPEIIEDGVEGFLIDGREPHKFADKCLFLSSTPDVYQRLADSAREKIATCFSVSAMAQKYYQTYLDTISQQIQKRSRLL